MGTATSTETKTVRHPMTRTSGPVVTSSVGSNGTVYYTTTVACVQCQCPGYVPGQLTVIATKSVCPVCVASTVTPVTATVIPCATCAALVLVLSPRLVEASHPHTLFLYQPPPPPVPQASRPQSSLQPLSPATQHPQLPTLVQLLPSAPR